MLALALSLATYAGGPLVYYALAEQPRAARILDTVVMASVAIMVLFAILPHTVNQLGWVAFLPLVIGVIGPTIIERSLSHMQESTHRGMLALVLIGIALHEFTDGLALAVPGGAVEYGIHWLPVAIVLHRFPAGVVMWWLLKPAFGLRLALVVFVAFLLVTVGGYASGIVLKSAVESPILAAFHSFVAGSLLHIAVHRFELHAEH